MAIVLRPGLASVEDTECIVAKAIRDGGVDAVLDHANSWMLSKDVANIYATAEPAAAFHERVAFCLDIHNEVRNSLVASPSRQQLSLCFLCHVQTFLSVSVIGQ